MEICYGLLQRTPALAALGRGPEALADAGEALALAEQGGYLVVVPRLRALTATPPA